MGKIVISGIGLLSSLGTDLDSHLKILKSEKFLKYNEKGCDFNDIVRKVEKIDIKKYVKNRKSIRFFSKQTKIGCYCSKIAIDDAKLTDKDIKLNERMNALILGSGYSQSLLPMADALISCVDSNKGILDYKKLGDSGYRMLPPLWILSRLPNTTSGQISIENGIKGLNYTVVNGVNSGIVSIGEAFFTIKQDRAIRVICGGIEDEILPDFIYELKQDKLLANNSAENRVFSKKSSGYSIAEGGCVLVVEKEDEALKRNANIYCEIVGYSNYYIPDINELKEETEISKYFEKNMAKCMKMAGVEPKNIDFIQASAGGDNLLDYSEAIAINRLFSKNTYITESKSYIGNTLAASGAMSVAFACLQLKNNFIAPILENKDIFLDNELKYVKNDAIDNESKICLVNSFSHLGEMCTLILKKR